MTTLAALSYVGNVGIVGFDDQPDFVGYFPLLRLCLRFLYWLFGVCLLRSVTRVTFHFIRCIPVRQQISATLAVPGNAGNAGNATVDNVSFGGHLDFYGYFLLRRFFFSVSSVTLRCVGFFSLHWHTLLVMSANCL